MLLHARCQERVRWERKVTRTKNNILSVSESVSLVFIFSSTLRIHVLSLFEGFFDAGMFLSRCQARGHGGDLLRPHCFLLSLPLVSFGSRDVELPVLIRRSSPVMTGTCLVSLRTSIFSAENK